MTSINSTFKNVSINTILSDPIGFAEKLRQAQSGINKNVDLHGDFDLFSYLSTDPEDANIGAAAAFDAQNLLLVARKNTSLQASPYGANPSGKIVNLFAIGSTGDDALIGGKGNDILVSGGSQTGFGDILKGGGGTDTFIVSNGLTYLHQLSPSSTILVPSYNGEFSLTVLSPFAQPPHVQSSGVSASSGLETELSVQVDIGGTRIVVSFTLDELNDVLGKNYTSIGRAYRAMGGAENSQLSSYIMSKVKSQLPTDDTSSRKTEFNKETGTDWNYAFGEQGKPVVGTMGRDSIFAKGSNVTLIGGAGGDNFHVRAGMGTVIADFNFHQRDRIVMDDVKLASFNKDKVTVERSIADFIVKYDGKTIAKLLNYDGMPRTDAPAKIKALVTGS